MPQQLSESSVDLENGFFSRFVQLLCILNVSMEAVRDGFMSSPGTTGRSQLFLFRGGACFYSHASSYILENVIVNIRLYISSLQETQSRCEFCVFKRALVVFPGDGRRLEDPALYFRSSARQLVASCNSSLIPLIPSQAQALNSWRLL